MVPDSESVLSQSDKQFGYNANARRCDEDDLSWRLLLLLKLEFELVLVRLSFDELVFCNWFLFINLPDGPIINVESFVDSINFKSTFGGLGGRIFDCSGCIGTEDSEDGVGI